MPMQFSELRECSARHEDSVMSDTGDVTNPPGQLQCIMSAILRQIVIGV